MKDDRVGARLVGWSLAILLGSTVTFGLVSTVPWAGIEEALPPALRPVVPAPSPPPRAPSPPSDDGAADRASEDAGGSPAVTPAPAPAASASPDPVAAPPPPAPRIPLPFGPFAPPAREPPAPQPAPAPAPQFVAAAETQPAAPAPAPGPAPAPAPEPTPPPPDASDPVLAEPPEESTLDVELLGIRVSIDLGVV